jgi:ASCH domain
MLENLRTLSIRQPHAEAIMRGTKTIEYRSRSTNVRGRIYIYASLGRYSKKDELEMLEDYDITDINSDDLPRGVLIGTVDLFDCEDGEWYLRFPKRLDTPVPPTVQPQPVWFYPFEEKGKTTSNSSGANSTPVGPETSHRNTPSVKARNKPSKSTGTYAKNWEKIFKKRS